METGRGKHVKKHHEKKDLCYKRPTYRESRWERAVKVYTINQESKYLLVLGVPTVGATKELLELFALYGDIEEYRVLHEYPVEEFTEAYWIKYKRIQSARFGKKKLDNRSFFGGLLHVCYAPEYENENDTREKLNERKRTVARKCKEYFTPKEPDSSKETSIEGTHTGSTISYAHNIPPPPPPPPFGAPPSAQPPVFQCTTTSRDIKQNIPRKGFEYPRIPTNQATLPLELQNLTASEVYPNLDENSLCLSNESTKNETRTNTIAAEQEKVADINPNNTNIKVDSKEEQKNKQKKIVWNKRAPDNPFAASHQYTRAPGACRNPYTTVNSGQNVAEEDTLKDAVSAIREKMKKTAEPAQNIQQFQEVSPLSMVFDTPKEEAPPSKKSRKNDGRKRI